MDTTKENREEGARRPRQQAPRKQGGVKTESRPKKAAPSENRKRPAGAAQSETPRKAPQTAPRQQKASTKTPPKKQERAAPEKKARPAPRKERPDDLSAKKRAYGNSKEKKKSSLSVMSKAISATAQESAQKRRARKRAEGTLSRYAQQSAPAVIYTQPMAFNRDRLVIQLLTVAAVVVAFVVAMSVFFKVGVIEVTGADVYEEYQIEDASGIQAGDNLLTFSRARAGAMIKANLPYVKNVSFGIKLPDTVNIIIEEEDVVYAIKDQDERWWLINSEGEVISDSTKGQAANYTQVLGVTIDHPMANQMAVAVEAMAVAPDPNADPLVNTEATVAVEAAVSGELRLKLALRILKALEANGIVGDAASINVVEPQGITLWYGTRYQVNLGDDSNLEEKIAIMNDVILQMSDYQSGILDVSFTIWPNQVGYTPFA